jgi:hypothetical protein
MRPGALRDLARPVGGKRRYTHEMSKKKRVPRPRSVARKAAASAEKLVTLRERLALYAPGGTPELPIAVDSAAVIELRAVREPCVACAAPLRVLVHVVAEGEGGLVRQVDLACTRCGRTLTRYFVVKAPLLH